MQKFGISENLQQKLMKEQHRTIRQTRDLVHWLENIFYANWYTLETLDETVSTHLDEMASETPSASLGSDDSTTFQSRYLFRRTTQLCIKRCRCTTGNLTIGKPSKYKRTGARGH